MIFVVVETICVTGLLFWATFVFCLIGDHGIITGVPKHQEMLSPRAPGLTLLWFNIFHGLGLCPVCLRPLDFMIYDYRVGNFTFFPGQPIHPSEVMSLNCKLWSYYIFNVQILLLSHMHLNLLHLNLIYTCYSFNWKD